MKRKVITIIALSLVTFAIGYLLYKAEALSKYKTIDLDNYKEYMEALKKGDTVILNAVDIPEEEYLAFNNIKIKNIVQGFEVLEEENNLYIRYILRDGNGNLTTAFGMGEETFSLVEAFADNGNVITNGKEYYSAIDKEQILKNNNIKTDIDLINFLIANKDKKLNIFSSVKEMKEVYAIKFYATIVFPKGNIALIEGDYTGYMFKTEMSGGTVIECSILEDETRYIFSFIWADDYFSEEAVTEALNTIVLSSKKTK